VRILFASSFVLASCIATAQKASVKPLIEKLPTSIRGLSVVDDRVAWFGGSKGYVGRTINGGATWKVLQVKDFEKVDFRSLYAFDSLRAMIANAGSPASILKTVDGGKTWQEVYRNEHAEIFLDGIDFWDDQRGIIYGDPINNRMEILKTHDGGKTWKEVNKQHRPFLNEGEASFAASGTGIRCYNKTNVVIATGGNTSRLWISHNDGENWHPVEVPIIQGKSSTGIFSIAQSKKKWMVTGGDFEVDTLRQNHVFMGSVTGFDWKMPDAPTGGYRSGIEYISGKTWIAVGQSGVDASFSDGKTWQAIGNEKGLHVVRRARKGSKIFAAGNGRVVEILIGK
jgi:photosystem II stability/assembly factor-like uncharacterized protein